MKQQLLARTVVAAVASLTLAGCQDAPTAVSAEIADAPSFAVNGGTPSFIQAAYLQDKRQYLVMTTNAQGQCRVLHSADNNAWDAPQDNRQCSNVFFGAAPVLGFAVQDDEFSGYAYGVKDGAVRAERFYEFSGKPRFNSGNGRVVGDLVTFIQAAYLQDKGVFLVMGTNAAGACRVYHSADNNNWESPSDSRQCSNVFFGTAPVQGFAVQDDKYTGWAYGVKDGKVRANGFYEFSGKPRFNSGNGRVVGDLVTFIQAAYLQDKGVYMVMGTNAAGQCRVYHSVDNNTWDAPQDNRQCSNAFFGTAPVQGFAVQDDAYTGWAYGVKDGKVRANGFYEFSGKPRFNSGNGRVVE